MSENSGHEPQKRTPVTVFVAPAVSPVFQTDLGGGPPFNIQPILGQEVPRGSRQGVRGVEFRTVRY